MSDAVRWLYQQHVGTLPQTSLRCYLCGAWSAEERYPVARGLADTFNSHYLAACPSSPWLCAACQWYFDSKAGHPDFRKMSLMVWESGWKQWERADMKQDIADTLRIGTGEDVYLVCSLSKKKHILLQAPLNSQGTRQLAIQVEEQQVFLGQTTWENLDRAFLTLLSMGHNKGEILSGNLYSNTLRKHGRLEYALWLSEQLEWCRNSALLDLLSYVTIVDKEGTDGPTEAARNGGEIAKSGLHTDQPGLQVEVPHLDLGTSRVKRAGVQPDHQQLDLFS